MTTDAVGRRQPLMSKNFGDGGPAFPVWELNGHGRPEMTGFGMSLRDWFAGQALAGELASYAGSCSDPANYAGDIAARCYKLADAMLAEREKRND